MRVLVYRRQSGSRYLPLVREGLARRGVEATVVACDTPEEAEAALPEADVLLSWGLPAGLYGKAPGLRWVQSIGAGIDDLLADPSLPAGVPITRVTGFFGPQIAEYVMAHLLAVSQDLRRAYATQARRAWEQWEPSPLRGKCLGVAGVGEIGRVVAARARAFGLTVLGLRRGPSPCPEVDRAYSLEQMGEFLPLLDYLVVTLPLTPETRHLFGRRQFSQLKRGSWLVNVGRGPVVDPAALIEALRDGHLGGAVLDAHEVEPLPADNPLWAMPNVTITPHISGLSDPVYVADYFGDNARRFVDGLPLKGLVDRRRGY
ncbi:MAG: D-2-hydroxyacid dehydrogenase [Bacillota bacterium]